MRRRMKRVLSFEAWMKGELGEASLKGSLFPSFFS